MIKSEITHYLMLQQHIGKLSDTVCFPLLPSDRSIPQGNFNKSTLLDSINGKTYIVRHENPESRNQELPYVEAEYRGVGFLDNLQNGFRLRSSEEQYVFTSYLENLGISIVHPIYAEADTQLIEYYPDTKSLADLWIRKDKTSIYATETVINALLSAHMQGVVLGDRWGPNELVSKEKGVIFIDFDIEIWGPEAREFELASLLYFTSFFAQSCNPSMLKNLRELYKKLLLNPSLNGIYNQDILNSYIRSYADYFSHAPKYNWSDKDACIQFFQEIIST